MMREPPDGAALLEAAQRALRETILPLLEEGARYDALMILRAMAIVEREIRTGESPGADERARFAAFLSEGSDAPLEVLARRFAAAIRAGVYDETGPRREAARAALLSAVRARVRETNPNALDR